MSTIKGKDAALETAKAAQLRLQAIASDCAAAQAVSLQIERAADKADVVDLSED